MTVTLLAGGKPGFVCLPNSFYAAPVKERSRVKENDNCDPDSTDYGKIDIGPRLPGRLRVGEGIEFV